MTSDPRRARQLVDDTASTPDTADVPPTGAPKDSPPSGPAPRREPRPAPAGGDHAGRPGAHDTAGEPAGPDTTALDEPEDIATAAGRPASLWGDAWRELRRNPLFLAPMAVIAVLTAMAVAPGMFTDADPRSCDLARSLRLPRAEAWFGYDLLGCDYYSRVVHGARVSISIGILVTAGAAAIALVLGSLAGYYGRLLDSVIARVTDIVFGLPFILGAIVLLSVVSNRGLLQVALVLILFGWPTMTRLTRSSVLAVRDSDYVRSARALGAGDLRVLTRHILPNALAPVLVYATIYVGIVVAAEATLSFLGVGLQLPAISWGLMISDAQSRVLSDPHLLLFPGAFLSVTVLAFILLGDALRDALDPKLR